MTHHWDPKQYDKFKRERNEPFFDLVQLIQPVHHSRILDLGCGNGALTKFIHEKFHASYTLGIDSSKEMLEKAAPLQNQQLHFEEMDISRFHSKEPFQLIISNAALQWIPNHADLFEHLTNLLAAGGQMAIQMPANQDYPTHLVAAELASEEPYRTNMKFAKSPIDKLLSMEEYAKLLDKLGYDNQIVRMQLYNHFLESTAGVIEWVKGSLLTYYKSHMDPKLYELFLKEYQQRLIEQLGWSEPFFFTMKRLFLWAQLPNH